MVQLRGRRFSLRAAARIWTAVCTLLLPLAAGAQGAGDPLASAAALVRAGQYDAAIAEVERALHTHPSDPRLLTVEGIAYSIKGDNAEALRALRAALRSAPGFPAALKAEAQILSREHSPEAAPVLLQVLRANPTDSTAREMLALAQARDGNCSAAVTNFQQIQPALGEHPESLLRYGACLFAQNAFSSAVPVFLQLVALEPSGADSRYDLALAQVHAGQNKQATQTLEPLLGDTQDLDTLTLAADAYESIGNTPRAVELLRRAIVLDPTRDDTYVRFAELCLLHESYQAGIDMVSAGIARLPRDSSLFLARGMLYGGMADYDKAASDFRAAESFDPKHGTGSYGVGLVQVQGNHYAQALSTVRAALKAHPRDAQLHFLLARILMQNGAQPGSQPFAEAEASAVEAVHLRPDLSSARDLLADIYTHSGRISQAVEQCRAALRIDPSDQTAMYHLLLASRKAGDTATVQELAKRLVELHQEARDQQSNHLHYRIVDTSGPAVAAPGDGNAAAHR